jgi:amino-acid N-acetyltransferase
VKIGANPPRHGVQTLLEGASLPTSDLADVDLRNFFFAGPRDAPIGLVGLQIAAPDALLRSLVVDVKFRSAGLGSQLVARAEEYARSRGVRSIYLLTTTAERFFSARGYKCLDRSTVPDSIRTTREFAEVCPATSAVMLKRLPA